MRSAPDRVRYDLPHPAGIALIAAGMAALTVATTLASAAEPAAGQAAVPEAERRAELTRLVRHDCGSCHGLTLAGGLGPPLTSAALAAKTPDYLKLVILYGRTDTAMPGWAPLLSEADARWIAEQLLRGFPDADGSLR